MCKKNEKAPVWMSENFDEAILAVDAVTDSEILAEIAEKAPLRDVREVAVDLLEDISLLRRIAKENSDRYIRLAALKKIVGMDASSENELEELACELLHGASEKDLKDLLPEFADFLPEQLLKKLDIEIVKSEAHITGHEPEYHQKIVYKGKLITSRII